MRTTRFYLACATLLLPVCFGIEVLEPAQLSGSFATVRFNKYIGPQLDLFDIHNVSVAGFRSLKRALVLSDTDCANVQGKAVLFTSAQAIFPLSDEYRTHELIQACGGVAVLRILQPAYGPKTFIGAHAADRDSDCCQGKHEVTIPVVSVWHGDMDPVLDFVLAGGEARISLTTIDEDIWDTQYRDSPVFHALLRWLLVAMTIVILILAVVASYYHRVLGKARRRESKCLDDVDLTLVMRITNKFSLVQSVLACEFIQCAIRIPYFAMGPGLISSHLTWEEFSFLSSIYGPFQITSILLSIFMYHKIGAMRWQQQHSPRVVISSVVTAIFFFITEIALGYVRAARYDAAEVLRLYLLFISVTIALASLVFWVYGILFLRKLHLSHRRVSESATKLTSRERARRRLTIWIMFGGFTRSIEIGATFLPGLFPLLMYTPHGIGASFFVTYLMVTLTSFGQVMAFFPQRISERRGTTDRNSANKDPFRDSVQLSVPDKDKRRDSSKSSNPVVLMP